MFIFFTSCKNFRPREPLMWNFLAAALIIFWFSPIHETTMERHWFMWMSTNGTTPPCCLHHHHGNASRTRGQRLSPWLILREWFTWLWPITTILYWKLTLCSKYILVYWTFKQKWAAKLAGLSCYRVNMRDRCLCDNLFH